MNNTKKIAAIAAMSTLGMMMASGANAVPDQPKNWEKCAGIAKAGKNDCGSWLCWSIYLG